MDKSELAPLKELAEKANAVSLGQIVASCETKEWADYIAAAEPDTVLALIDEIERLEEDLDIRFQDNRVLKDQNQRVARTNMELLNRNQRLKKEADWLAGELRYRCIHCDCREHCIYGQENAPRCPVHGHVDRWREVARKAVAVEEGNG